MRGKFFGVVLAMIFASLMPAAYAESPAGALPQLPPGQSLGLALGIATVPNLRDLGGYRTSDGRTVARGLVYRSDRFDPMSPKDIKKLAPLALKNDYDLRSDSEALADPDELPAGVHHVLLNVLAGAKSKAPAQLDSLMRDPQRANATLGGGKVEALYIEGYRAFVSLPSAQLAYRTLFLALADKGKLPGVFHCTNGKDRTGWAAAALLTLLGVPRDVVMADFLRSNENILPAYRRAMDRFIAAGGDRSLALAIFGVKPEYLDAAFDEMRTRYGTIETYFADGLGIDAAGQTALRRVFLTE